ncbi:MAG: hypothetical protein PHS86_02995 [Syntrophaceae bacterium]|nr:hypothetical protein [Syntrophaceae bacterium]
MLIYHPGFDAYHCVFRMLAVCETLGDLEIEKARLLDFYLLYPALVAKMKLPRPLRPIARDAAAVANVYHDPSSPATMFRDMRHIQEAALRCIAAAGLIDVRRYENGFVTRTDVVVPDAIRRKIALFIASRQPISQFVLKELAAIPLGGSEGLKHRSQLMDHKYDFV